MSQQADSVLDYDPSNDALIFNRSATRTPSENDENDFDYAPNDSQNDVHSTPSNRFAYLSALPKIQKDRVKRADPREYCLIEQTSADNVIQYSHIVPRKAKSNTLDILEYCWKMNTGTLNLHSRYNIFLLTTKFHYLFDQNKFLFLPSDDVLEQYLKHSRRLGLDELPHKPTPDGTSPPTFTYRLVAHPSMQGVPIHRQESGFSETSLDESNFRSYFYPYRDLPPIESHVLPHFVIFNAGYKLSSPGFLDDINESGHYNDLSNALFTVFRIHATWINVVLSQDFGDFLQENQRGDTESDAGRTEPTRFQPHRAVKRYRGRGGSNEQATPSKKSKGSKGGQGRDAEGSVTLNESSLRLADPDGFAERNKKVRKKAFVSRWLKGVPVDSFEGGQDGEQGNDVVVPVIRV